MSFVLRHPRDGRIHFSDAKAMAVSPAHARYGVEHPREATPAMRRGTAIDRLVFGGQLVKCSVGRESKVWAAIDAMVTEADYVVYEGAARNGGKWEAFAAENAGRTVLLDKEYQAAVDVLGPRKPKLDEIVTPDEYALADGAAAAVLGDPVVRDLGLLKGEQQRVMQWDMGGLPWGAGIPAERGGIDILGSAHLADLKATVCTEPVQWSRQARRMLYVEQLAAYREAARSIGRSPERHYLIGVEVKPPFVVTVLEVPAEELDAGLRNVLAWCERIRACEAADHWPGYVQAAWPIEPKSAWEMGEDADNAG